MNRKHREFTYIERRGTAQGASPTWRMAQETKQWHRSQGIIISEILILTLLVTMNRLSGDNCLGSMVAQNIIEQLKVPGAGARMPKIRHSSRQR